MDQPSVFHIKTPSGADKALLCAKSAVLIEVGTGRVFDYCDFAERGLAISLSDHMQTYPSPAIAHTGKFWGHISCSTQLNSRFPLIQFHPIDDVLEDDWKPIQPSLDRLTSYVRRGLAYQRKRAVYMAMHPLLIRHAPIGRLDADTIELIIRRAL
jgi:hypothetical protein